MRVDQRSIAHSRSLWHEINAGIGKHHGTELAGLPCHDEARLGVLERLASRGNRREVDGNRLLVEESRRGFTPFGASDLGVGVRLG